MTTITTQRIVGALKRSGLTIAQFHRSGQVVGWGHFSEGYKVRKNGDRISVQYEEGEYAFRMQTGVRKQRHAKAIDTAREILLAAGFRVEIANLETHPSLVVGP